MGKKRNHLPDPGTITMTDNLIRVGNLVTEALKLSENPARHRMLLRKIMGRIKRLYEVISKQKKLKELEHLMLDREELYKQILSRK